MLYESLVVVLAAKICVYGLDLGRIENLSLHRCQRLTTVGIAALSRCAFFTIKLKRLNLSYNKFIHDEALAAFAQCTELNTLNLDHTDVSEAKAFLLQSKCCQVVRDLTTHLLP